jgi:predicted lactoylglutathione lyase
MAYIAANLPAINFDATCDFYRILGFQSTDQSNQWMNG